MEPAVEKLMCTRKVTGELAFIRLARSRAALTIVRTQTAIPHTATVLWSSESNPYKQGIGLQSVVA
jgi:hypothetical protein